MQIIAVASVISFFVDLAVLSCSKWKLKVLYLGWQYYLTMESRGTIDEE